MSGAKLAKRAIFSGQTGQQLLALAQSDPDVRQAARVLLREASGWDSLPNGWTQKSAQKFWDSLTGAAKHKVTACLKLAGNPEEQGAFCASLASLVGRKTAAADVQPRRQRTQYTCMATSMAMCLKANGVEASEDEVNRVMGAKPMQGASWEQAFASAQHFGMRVTFICPATLAQVKEYTDRGVPVMIAWNPEGRPWSHASVIFDVDEDNVHVADPNIPDPEETVRVLPKSEFYKKWFEQWPDYLVRRPAMAVEREVSPDGKQMVAKGKAQPAPKSQGEKSKDKKKVVVEPSTPRNDAARSLAEGGNRGRGVHQNKGDFERGKARRPKHKNQEKEAAQPLSTRPDYGSEESFSALFQKLWER